MGVKSTIKKYLAIKLKNILVGESTPEQIQSTAFVFSGKETFHNGNFEVRGSQKVKIGSYCAFGKDIKIITKNHDYDFPALQYSFYKKKFDAYPLFKKQQKEFSVEIGNDVWIGDNVIILPNVSIGNGVIIAAGSVVARDVEDYSIIGGIPAKIIKKRFSSDVIALFQETKWWEWSDEKIKENKNFFFKNYNKDV